jgi:hypothetical protein
VPAHTYHLRGSLCTVAEAYLKRRKWREADSYVAAQSTHPVPILVRKRFVTKVLVVAYLHIMRAGQSGGKAETACTALKSLCPVVVVTGVGQMTSQCAAERRPSVLGAAPGTQLRAVCPLELPPQAAAPMGKRRRHGSAAGAALRRECSRRVEGTGTTRTLCTRAAGRS